MKSSKKEVFSLYTKLIEIYAELSDRKIISKSGMLIKLSVMFFYIFEANHAQFIKYQPERDYGMTLFTQVFSSLRIQMFISTPSSLYVISGVTIFLTLLQPFLLYIIIKAKMNNKEKTSMMDYINSIFLMYCNSFYFYLFMPLFIVNTGHVFCSNDLYKTAGLQCN